MLFNLVIMAKNQRTTVEALYTRQKGKEIESINNESVKNALELVAELQSNAIGNLNDCIDKSLEMLKSIPEANKEKANTIFPHILLKMMNETATEHEREIIKSVVNFMNSVKYEIDEICKGQLINDDLFEIVNNSLCFDISPYIFSVDGRKPSEAFKSRISFYNPIINFEHVCFMFALIALNKFKIEQDEYYTDILLYSFNYFLSKYIENCEYFRVVICHLMKLIRIYYINSLATKPDNMFKFMANLHYNVAYNDPNIEFYGDIRLTTGDTLLDNFMFSPRTTGPCTELDNILWFNYNINYGIISQFTTNANKLFEIVNNSYQMSQFYSIKAFLLLMTKLDIEPRNEAGREQIYTVYKRIKMTEESDVNKYIANFFKIDPKYKPTDKQLEAYGNHIIGLTYINEDGEVVSKAFTNIRFKDLVARIYEENDEEEDITEDHHVIEECYINVYNFDQTTRRYKIKKISENNKTEFMDTLANLTSKINQYEFKNVLINSYIRRTFY